MPKTTATNYTYEAPNGERSELRLSLASARKVFQGRLLRDGGRLVRVNDKHDPETCQHEECVRERNAKRQALHRLLNG